MAQSFVEQLLFGVTKQRARYPVHWGDLFVC